MPGACCTRGLVCNVCVRVRTRAYRYSRNNPAFPAQWLYGLCRALPGDEFLFVTVALRIDDAVRPVELAAPPQGLTVATTARTTRFCRTQDTTFTAPAWSVPPRRSLCEGR